MDRLAFAAIADDDTGASDLAGMLADRGLETLLVLDLPDPDRLQNWIRGSHAVIMAEGTRMAEPQKAYERTRAAIRLLAAAEPRMFQIKYCSTFDSTERGNIGPSIDAALDELNEPFTIALPALPVNGRTTYMGYHFVHRQLLSDSPMRHHPLTPMTNPNLVDFLGRQTKRKVGLAAHPFVEAGPEALEAEFQRLRSEGIAIAVADCLNERDVDTICRASAGMRLITGGSAPGIGFPPIWREKGWLRLEAETVERHAFRRPGAGCLVVAGSCSVATRGQNDWFIERGAKAIRLDARELAAHAADLDGVAAQASEELRSGRHCLIATSADPNEIEAAHEWAASKGMSRDDLGAKVVDALAGLVRRILDGTAAGGLICAGGETAGAVCRRLEIEALRVARNIEPGVPLCFSLGRLAIPVVLKSGNFGSRDFYGRAWKAMGY